MGSLVASLLSRKMHIEYERENKHMFYVGAITGASLCISSETKTSILHLVLHSLSCLSFSFVPVLKTLVTMTAFRLLNIFVTFLKQLISCYLKYFTTMERIFGVTPDVYRERNWSSPKIGFAAIIIEKGRFRSSPSLYHQGTKPWMNKPTSVGRICLHIQPLER